MKKKLHALRVTDLIVIKMLSCVFVSVQPGTQANKREMLQLSRPINAASYLVARFSVQKLPAHMALMVPASCFE